MDVSIIIVNYNTINLVIDCIKSIKEFTTGISYEIIIVDNHSNDNIETSIQEAFGPDPSIQCYTLQENIGFGKANNFGFAHSKGRHLFCLNPDTLLLNNAIKILSDYLDNNKYVGICGGNLYDMEKKPCHSYMRMMPSVCWELSVLTFHKIEKAYFHGNEKFNHTNVPIEVAYITGADLMIRRDIAIHVGGYTKDYFMFFEETDLCLKVKKCGLKIVNVPQAKIQHLEGQSYAKNGKININKKSIKFWEEGRLLFYKLNVKPSQARLANFIYKMALYLNMFTFRLLNRPIWENYKYRIETVREISKEHHHS